MKKPEHQWETRLHRARREPGSPEGAWAGDSRAEAFVLEFADGHRGRATLGLARQEVDARSAADPDLPHAVKCWLAARGVRKVDLWTDAGDRLVSGGFTVAELGDAPGPVPRTVVTLAPSNAEMMDVLGAFDRVVACEDSTDVPAAESLPRLGPDLGPDLDRVAALGPDRVVSSLTVPGMERVVTGLRRRGLRQVVIAPRSLAEVAEALEHLGRHLGREAAAARAVADLRRQQAELQRARPAKPVRVYLEWWPRPMFSPGRDCYANELIALAGGVNVFGDRPGSSVRIEPADLIHADPDVCFVSWCGVAEAKLDPQNLIGRAGLEPLRAARLGRVHPLDERFSGRPGPHMLEAARRMAEAIRPLLRAP